MSIPVLANLTYQTTTQATPQNLGKSRFINMSKTAITMPDGSTVQPYQFWVKDGKVVEIDGIDSIKMWITKILKTEKQRYNVYINYDYYGVFIKNLVVGKSYPTPFIDAEIKREVRSAMLLHPLVNSVQKMQNVAQNDRMTCSYEVILKDNSVLEVQEVI